MRRKHPPADFDDPPRRRNQYRTGGYCWYVNEWGRWFLCQVVRQERLRMWIRPVTGRDATRRVSWPFDNELEIVSRTDSPMYNRLRPLKDRKT